MLRRLRRFLASRLSRLLGRPHRVNQRQNGRANEIQPQVTTPVQARVSITSADFDESEIDDVSYVSEEDASSSYSNAANILFDHYINLLVHYKGKERDVSTIEQTFTEIGAFKDQFIEPEMQSDILRQLNNSFADDLASLIDKLNLDDRYRYSPFYFWKRVTETLPTAFNFPEKGLFADCFKNMKKIADNNLPLEKFFQLVEWGMPLKKIFPGHPFLHYILKMPLGNVFSLIAITHARPEDAAYLKHFIIDTNIIKKIHDFVVNCDHNTRLNYLLILVKSNYSIDAIIEEALRHNFSAFANYPIPEDIDDDVLANLHQTISSLWAHHMLNLELNGENLPEHEEKVLLETLIAAYYKDWASLINLLNEYSKNVNFALIIGIISYVVRGIENSPLVLFALGAAMRDYQHNTNQPEFSSSMLTMSLFSSNGSDNRGVDFDETIETINSYKAITPTSRDSYV